jgi:hypothetical protein
MNISHKKKKELLEIEKLQAEILKTQAEENEIKKRTKKGFWSGEFIAKTTIGAVVSSVIIISWFITNLQPILERNEILYDANRELFEKSKEYEVYKLKKQQDSLLIRSRELKEIHDSLIINKENLHKELLELKKIREQLIKKAAATRI